MHTVTAMAAAVLGALLVGAAYVAVRLAGGGRRAAGESVGEAVGRQLAVMSERIGQVGALVQELERDRASKFGELTSRLREAGEQTAALAQTTQALRETLANSRARGQWGERMAEDVLRLAGFAENVNYRRQRAVEGGVPDFTFLMPRDRELHMDVKFPLDNYVRYLDASTDGEREHHLIGFLRDVRSRVKELAARPYLSSAGSVDCLLLFIPNESLYAFIQEHDAGLLDEALRRKVVLCSPLTLFAVLAVVRQAVDNFVVEQTSSEVLSLLGDFSKQWAMFSDQLDRLGSRLEGAQRDYEALSTTRRRQLERQLDRIEDLRARRGHDDGAAAAGEVAPVDGNLALVRPSPP